MITTLTNYIKWHAPYQIFYTTHAAQKSSLHNKIYQAEQYRSPGPWLISKAQTAHFANEAYSLQILQIAIYQ